MNCSRTLNLETKENKPIAYKEQKDLMDSYMEVEKGFNLFSMFIIKVTHVVATSIQLLANNLEEENLGKEDRKLLYNFLTNDWDKVLMARKGKKKEASKWLSSFSCFWYSSGLSPSDVDGFVFLC